MWEESDPSIFFETVASTVFFGEYLTQNLWRAFDFDVESFAAVYATATALHHHIIEGLLQQFTS